MANAIRQAGFNLVSFNKEVRLNGLNPLNKPVILYAPNYNNTPAQDIINAGAYVVCTQEELLELLRRLGEP